MGEDVDAQEFSRADRTRHREKVHRCLDVFARMLSEHQFDTDDPMTGLEVELNLADEQGDPALKNAEALAAIADPAFQTELGQFNIEINVPPAKLRESGLSTFEANLRRSLNDAERKIAAALPQMLAESAARLKGGAAVEQVLGDARARLLAAGFASVDYVALCDETLLQPIDRRAPGARLFVAAHLGRTRLIDNCVVG